MKEKCEGKWIVKRYEHGLHWVPCHGGTIVSTQFIHHEGKKMRKRMGTSCNVCGTRYFDPFNPVAPIKTSSL